jgi:hypothetical protein
MNVAQGLLKLYIKNKNMEKIYMVLVLSVMLFFSVGIIVSISVLIGEIFRDIFSSIRKKNKE